VSQYLPELLSGAEAGGSGDMEDYDISVPGSRVDISVGETPIAGAFPEDASEGMDDIDGNPSFDSFSTFSHEPALSQAEPSQAGPSQAEHTPLDQEKKTGYNQKRDFADDIGSLVDPETVEEAPAEALPDMGNLGGNFVESEQGMEVESIEPPEPRHSSSQKPIVADDFNAKELAKAIQTVLKKDEKG
jgi:hypothetical protein